MLNRDSIIEDTRELLNLVTNTDDLDNKINSLSEQIEQVKIIVKQMLNDKGNTESHDEFVNRYESYIAKYDNLNNKLDEVLIEKDKKISKFNRMTSYISDLEKCPNIINEFDLTLWNTVIDEAVVNKDRSIRFKFKNELEIVL